jgi:dual specificity phosphatase 3
MTNDTLPLAEFANLHFVTPRLAVGGDLSARSMNELSLHVRDYSKLGITHVVDCRLEWDDAQLFESSLPWISYLHHGIDDAGQDVPGSWFEAAISWIDDAGDDAVVLTHCHMGINRGPSLGFAVLLHWGWDPIDAIDAIRAARPVANVWYAPDALLWHHARLGTDATDDLRRLKAWREQHPLDVVRIIRTQRDLDR